MSWAVGYNEKWKRDIGYGVPAICDHPKCNKEIDRGLSYVCGEPPYGQEHGCGLHFCWEHLSGERGPREEKYTVCTRCGNYKPPFKPKPDTAEWEEWKLTDESWGPWRDDNPDLVEQIRQRITEKDARA